MGISSSTFFVIICSSGRECIIMEKSGTVTTAVSLKANHYSTKRTASNFGKGDLKTTKK